MLSTDLHRLRVEKVEKVEKVERVECCTVKCYAVEKLQSASIQSP